MNEKGRCKLDVLTPKREKAVEESLTSILSNELNHGSCLIPQQPTERTRAVLRLVWPASVFHTPAACV